MLSRVLFLVLIAANASLAAMLYWQPHHDKPLPPPTDPGVAKLVLLSEREASEAEINSAELSEAPATQTDSTHDHCFSLGSFTTQSDMRQAMTILTPSVNRIRPRESISQQSRGWSVFLPAPASREEALNIARSLYERGVRDYYVVTAGEQQNTISLGLFREHNNAEKRRAEIARLGFNPSIVERKEDSPQYWIDIALPVDSTLPWQTQLANFSQIKEKTINCF